MNNVTTLTSAEGEEVLTLSGTREKVFRVTAGGETFAVEDEGNRWTPGTPVPRDRQPDALLALARNAEAHERHLNEEREGTRRERRRAA